MAPQQVKKSEETEHDQEKADDEQSLKFVRGEGNLKQVFHRQPDDGLFPTIKHIDEMEACDVELLIKNNLVDILKKVIARE